MYIHTPGSTQSATNISHPADFSSIAAAAAAVGDNAYDGAGGAVVPAGAWAQACVWEGREH